MEAEPDEAPVRDVTVGTFWIDRAEVRAGDYWGCAHGGPRSEAVIGLGSSVAEWVALGGER